MGEADLDALVRRVDPGRWLASRFIADEARRAVVVALYALDYELARVGASVSQPLVGEIRLAWWRERIEAIAAGEPPPAEPVLAALHAPIASGALPLSVLETLIEARHADLEPAPFADETALLAYLDGAAGTLMHLAARVLDPDVDPAVTSSAGRAWGWAQILQAGPAWRKQARRWAPLDWGEVSNSDLGVKVCSRIHAAIAAARRELKALPVLAFPAVSHIALVRVRPGSRPMGELERRLRLTFAVLTGRI